MNDLRYIPRREAMEKLGIKSFAGIKKFEKTHKVAPVRVIDRRYVYRLDDIRRALGEDIKPADTFTLGPVWEFGGNGK
jgi:hypothetical protein